MDCVYVESRFPQKWKHLFSLVPAFLPAEATTGSRERQEATDRRLLENLRTKRVDDAASSSSSLGVVGSFLQASLLRLLSARSSVVKRRRPTFFRVVPIHPSIYLLPFSIFPPLVLPLNVCESVLSSV